MAQWATKRRFLYGGSFVIIVTLIFGGIFWKVFYNTPTCTDGKKNSDETGIDCGGSCKLLCTSDALAPVVLWSKVFNVSDNLYTVVAYIQNPNINSKNVKANYEFRIFDASNKLITVKSGQTSIPKNKKFAVFEVGIVLKNVKPKSADFEFTSFSSWQKDTTKEPEISIKHSTLLDTTTTPHLEGTITNNSFSTISSIELDAFVLDDKENVLGASRTFVDNLDSRTSQNFVFTWPKLFDRDASVVTVIYRAL